MNEQIPVQESSNTPEKSRNLEIAEMKAEMVLQKCLRKSLKLKDMFLEAMVEPEAHDEKHMKLYTDSLNILSESQNYDLNNKDDYNKAKKDVAKIFLMYAEAEQIDSNIPNPESGGGWINVGVMSYELGEEGEIFIHVPAMKERPGLQQIRESLQKISQFLIENPGIKMIRGSSLLLEHSLAKRLGFEIDTESDNGKTANFKMMREEFIERFAKKT